MSAEINLAGLSTLALLALFFPSIGIFERWRRRNEARANYMNREIRKMLWQAVEREKHSCSVNEETAYVENRHGELHLHCEKCGCVIFIGRERVGH